MSRQPKQRIILNVYDLIQHNDYTYQLGLGAYHSGVEIAGIGKKLFNIYALPLSFMDFTFTVLIYYITELTAEYSFGGHDGRHSGVFTVEPRAAYGVRFREAILLGESSLTSTQIQKILQELSSQFTGNSYHILSRNCNQ